MSRPHPGLPLCCAVAQPPTAAGSLRLWTPARHDVGGGGGAGRRAANTSHSHCPFSLLHPRLLQHPSAHPPTSPPSYPSTVHHPRTHPSLPPSLHPSIYPSVRPSVHPPARPLTPLACPLGVSYNDVSVSASLSFTRAPGPAVVPEHREVTLSRASQSPGSAVVGGHSGTCNTQHADPRFLLNIKQSLGGGGLRGAVGPNLKRGTDASRCRAPRGAACPASAPEPPTAAP